MQTETETLLEMGINGNDNQKKSGIKIKKEKKPKKRKKEILHELFIELVKLQKEVIASDLKLLVILEGRDAAGKDGTIKRIIKHLSPRETIVVAWVSLLTSRNGNGTFSATPLTYPFRENLFFSTEAGTTALALKR